MAKKGKRSTISRAAARTTDARKGATVRKGKGAKKKAPAHPVKGRKTKTAELKYDPAVLGPKHWTKEELTQFKEMILAKRQETLEELDTLKESMMDVTTGEYVSESSNYSLHMEQGTDAMEREKTFLLASRGSKFINQLDDALTRIEGGNYGVCRTCELLIPRERLEAVPTAQTCAEFKNTNMPCERGKIALALKQQRK